jgi:hypothetical protein
MRRNSTAPVAPWSRSCGRTASTRSTSHSLRRPSASPVHEQGSLGWCRPAGARRCVWSCCLVAVWYRSCITGVRRGIPTWSCSCACRRGFGAAYPGQFLDGGDGFKELPQVSVTRVAPGCTSEAARSGRPQRCVDVAWRPGQCPWTSPRVSSARVRSTRYTSRPWCCKCWTREMTAFAGFRSVRFLRAWGWQAWVCAFCPTVPRRLFPGMGARPVRWGRALVLRGLRRVCGACGAPAAHARVVTGRGLSGVR